MYLVKITVVFSFLILSISFLNLFASLISLVSGFSISLVFLFKKLLFENILYYIFVYYFDFLLYTYMAIYFYVYATYFPLAFQGYNCSTFMYYCFRVLLLVLNIF